MTFVLFVVAASKKYKHQFIPEVRLPLAPMVMM
jgi:hypothetical protein